MEAMDAEVRPRVPFPPRPRAWAELIERIVDGAANAAGAIAWEPIRIAGLEHPWIGVHAEALGAARAWQWDVITPEDRARDASLRHDPLALAVEQDVMVVDVRRQDDPQLKIRLQVPVKRMPKTIDVSASALPPPPWYVELATGWSAPCIAAAVDAWMREHVGRTVSLVPPPPLPDPGHSDRDTDRFSIGEDLWATDEAFDALLALDPRHASLVTTTLLAVREALDPYR
jgi:hypothetical protein